ncbi:MULTISPECIES: ABC transporter substrate-binding protein [unclassified Halomonas]|uniref:ABC transporter substrate-binding protein n=1 Tax=unclassified Halomonas TaxID=2609666 RepID=UPI00209FBFBF|nr:MULTISPECIES: ABC transporter substrate-binding protein [unclassified Halomonas]MCP1316061.1 ABC transporter substrate-binding protein [Halomonas sp. 707D7]MCP1327758.1 ABC transporter substrate-binding protein [Halomonas sp. 707D4]
MGQWGAAGALMGALMMGQAQARTLDTAFGEVEVEGTPERVVTLYEGALDSAIAAGVMPLGAVSTRGGTDVADYITAYFDDERPAMVGVVREINIEAVLAQQPDLILTGPQLPEEQYQLLSRIAPTVVPPGQDLAADNWEAEARLFGEALDREEAIEEAIDAVEARIATLSERIEQAHPGQSAFVVRWMPGGPMVMSKELIATGLLERVGLEVSDAGLIKEGSAHSDALSLENLSMIDGDWLFLATLNEDGEAALDAARQSAAFTRLNVVQNDQVVVVNGQLWSSASGPLAAQAILDDIENALLP